MRIGIDLDGVLASFNPSFVQCLHRHGCTVDFPVQDPDWPSTWHWDRAAGVPLSVSAAAWNEVAHSLIFWVALSPVPGADDDLERLSEMDLEAHAVYFLTVRPGASAKLQTELWLKWRGIKMPTVLVAADATKHFLTRALQLDAIIDDKPDNLLGHQPRTRLFLYDQPYNRDYQSEEVERVYSVSDMLDRLGV
jgi:hypothetical protein